MEEIIILRGIWPISQKITSSKFGLELDNPKEGEELECVLRNISSDAERFLADEVSLEDAVESLLLRQHISEALRSLRPRDARVVRLYYGLQGEESHTLEQIGQLLGVTRERVRQLRDRALRELKEGAQGEALASFAA